MISLGDPPLDTTTNNLLSRWPAALARQDSKFIIKYKGNTFFESRDYSHYNQKSITDLQRLVESDNEMPVNRSLRTKNVSKQLKKKQDVQSTRLYRKQLGSLIESYPLSDDG